MNKISVLFCASVIFGLILISGTGFVLAQPAPCVTYCADPVNNPQPVGVVCICNPVGDDRLEDLIDNVVTFLFLIAIVLAPLMFIASGFLFITAAGNPEQIKRAKDLAFWTVIGFTIIMLARALISFLSSLLGV